MHIMVPNKFSHHTWTTLGKSHNQEFEGQTQPNHVQLLTHQELLFQDAMSLNHTKKVDFLMYPVFTLPSWKSIFHSIAACRTGIRNTSLSTCTNIKKLKTKGSTSCFMHPNMVPLFSTIHLILI